MNYNETYNLLIRYIDGETSVAETELMEGILNSNPIWKLEHENLIKINAMLKTNHSTDSLVESNWSMLQKSIDQKKASKFYLPSFYKFAAAAVFILLAALYFILPGSAPNFADGQLYKTGPKEIKHIVLSDGSSIALNENSSLQLDENFNEKTRNIKLQGSAFFEVKDNPEKPFVAYAGNTQTKVLGTSFLLQNKNKQKVLLKLYKGKVHFTTEDKSETLNPGEEIQVVSETGTIIKSPLDNTIREPWMLTGLNFKDQTISSIISKLETVHSVKIKIPDSMANDSYTVSFNGLDLKSSLVLLEALTDSKITLKDSIYILKP